VGLFKQVLNNRVSAARTFGFPATEVTFISIHGALRADTALNRLIKGEVELLSCSLGRGANLAGRKVRFKVSNTAAFRGGVIRCALGTEFLANSVFHIFKL
jgi:hypothetical protein